MAKSTDSMYNASSRYLHQKFLIYFTTTPLEVTKEDYLVSSSVLEELTKISDTPFGTITSNELTLSLYNDNGIFNPQNTSSPYYGHIKKGVRIEAFIRPDEVDEWDDFGVFYVTEWSTSTNGSIAEVVANDALYDVLNDSVRRAPIYTEMPIADYARTFFNSLGMPVSIDADVTHVVPYIYSSKYNYTKDYLSDLMNASLCDCYVDHSGVTRVRNRVSNKHVRATLTDSDQIMSVSVKQSISNSYSSATVMKNMCRESKEATLLTLTNVDISPGMNSIDKTLFSSVPVVSVKAIRTSGNDKVTPLTFSATATDFTCSLRSTATTVSQIDVIGTYLEVVSSVVGDPSETVLEVDNPFIQTSYSARRVLDYCMSYILASMPTVELSVRGNPRLSVGDKIRIISNRYKIDYTGIILKAQYDYVGSLSCSLTLMTDIEGGA